MNLKQTDAPRDAGRKGPGQTDMERDIFHDLLEHADQAFFIAQDGKLVYLNPVVSRFMGYSRDELMASPFAAFIHPDDRSAVIERQQRRLKGENPPQGYPFRIVHRDGTVRWVELNASLTQWNGRPATLNSLREMSKQEDAEEALRATREELRLTLQATTDGIWQWNFITNEMRFSSRYYTMLGYHPKAFPPSFKAWQDLLHPDDRPKAVSFAKTYLGSSKDDYENIYRLRTASGEYRWVHSRARVVERDGDGNAVRMIGRIEDITKLKQAEAELQERERRFRDLFDSIRDPILVADPDRNITDCNPAFSDLFGYAINEIKGRKTSLIYEKEEQYEEIGRALKASPGSKEIISVINFKKKSGDVFTGEVKLSYVRDEKEKISGVIGQIRDLSERLQADAERAELEAQFRQAQKLEAVGRLTGGVAHDFNNLLAVINGYSELMLLELKEASPLRKRVLQIREAGQKAGSLIRQLMAFSRKQVLRPEVLNLNSVLSNMEKMLPRIIGEDIAVAFHLGSDLGNVRADAGQIEQVIMNLVVNARDAMPEGGKLTIETANAELSEGYAQRHAKVAPGLYVMLAVSDTGVGMDQTVMEQVFDPFFTTKEKGKGTGLGLSTVYGIVKQHAGHVWVYSEPGRGSTFKVYLPRASEEVQPGRTARKDTAAGGAETILVVEDHKDVRELIEAMLRSLGYRVFAAASGQEALALCEREKGPLHLLLTDLVMPGMTGRDLARRVVEIRPSTKVLFMSGYTTNGVVGHGVLDKGVHFIQKPFTLSAVAEKVRTVLADPDDQRNATS